MMTAAPMLPGVEANADPAVRWFSERGCVVHHDGVVDVFVGGTLFGSFGPRASGTRNAIVVLLAGDPKVHLGRLAEAFDLTSEGLRLIRRQYEADGLAAVVARKRGGGVTKVTPALRRKLERLFEEQLSVPAILSRIGKRGRVSRSTVYALRAEWFAARAPSMPGAEPTTITPQVPIPLDAGARASNDDGRPEVAPRAADEDEGADTSIDATAPASGTSVQHLGTWLMIAMLARLGLHRRAEQHRGDQVGRGTLRLALDAVIAALSLGERCVEGVRRLATPTAPLLLLSARAPSASWVRRVIGRFAEKMGGWFHLDMAAGYLQAAREDEQAPAVFYVDNHLRPYSGQEVLRRGWRMQDKRVVPGASDYYVHDQDGRPVLRRDAPSNGPLTQFLTPIARLLRLALGPAQRILLAFDRAGAYPEQLAELREEGFEFVTYERRPFPMLHASAFDGSAELDGETVAINDARINLGGGRGRVRRIAIRVAEGRQVNLLATSDQPAQRLIDVMRGRWSQENAFKHGVERWGINQLDGRTTEPYPPDTIIPNPARRRLDHALRIAKVREGDARRELARLSADDPRRLRYETEIAAALEQQNELEAQRPSTPKHAPLMETELADKLVHHTSEYKLVLDTIRIACANAEADLAGELGPHLRRPAEAKRVLRNLLMAPGRVRVGKTRVGVTLQPAASSSEMDAMRALLTTVNRWGLRLPGDPRRRLLRFSLPQES